MLQMTPSFAEDLEWNPIREKSTNSEKNITLLKATLKKKNILRVVRLIDIKQNWLKTKCRSIFFRNPRVVKMLKHFLNYSPSATFGCALGFTNCCLQNLGCSCGLLYVFFCDVCSTSSLINCNSKGMISLNNWLMICFHPLFFMSFCWCFFYLSFFFLFFWGG